MPGLHDALQQREPLALPDGINLGQGVDRGCRGRNRAAQFFSLGVPCCGFRPPNLCSPAVSGARKDQDVLHVVKILDEQLATVQSRDAGQLTLAEILKRADGSEADRSDQLRGDRVGFLRDVEQLAATSGGPETLAQILNAVAAHALSRTEAASTAMSAAYAVFGAGPPSLSEAAGRGRSVLRDAVLDNMHDLEKLEAKVFVAVNGLPQPEWLRKAGRALEFLATGGRPWVISALIPGLARSSFRESGLMRAAPFMPSPPL